MARISGKVGRLILVMAALTAMAIVALPAAAAELPFRDGAAAAVSAAAPVNVAGLMPGDAVAPQSIAIGAGRPVDFRATAHVSGSPAMARSLQVLIIATATNVVLYNGPLAGASVTGNTGSDGPGITAQVSMTTTAGNDVQGGEALVHWDVTTSDSAPAT